MKTSRTAALLLALAPTLALAQSADSGVDVGPDGSGASAGYVGDWGIAKTESRDGFGRALGVGVTKDGVAISHSIGASNGSSGVGHNFNMAVGRDGAHVSQGGVVTSGGNGRVQAGGSGSQQGGGSEVVGWGDNTKAWTESRTRQWGSGSQYQPVNSGGGSQFAPAVMPNNYKALGNSNSNNIRPAVMPSNSGGNRGFNLPSGRKFRFGR